jgi:pimeloyl-ACP methyl ester carboxylesterase
VRLVLVHGSVANGQATWAAQQPLAGRFELLVWNRPGYPPNPPLERIDFAEQAAELAGLLRPGDHLCGHSYGGVIALLAAPGAELGSLTVVEPPAFGVVRGDPAVEEFVGRVEALFAALPDSPEEYLRRFLPIVGSPFDVPERLSRVLAQGTRAAMAERPPQEAAIPLDELAAAPFPKLVVSGGHHAALDAVCDALVQRLGAERAVVPGAGHSIPRLGESFNRVLADFLERAPRRHRGNPTTG